MQQWQRTGHGVLLLPCRHEYQVEVIVWLAQILERRGGGRALEHAGADRCQHAACDLDQLALATQMLVRPQSCHTLLPLTLCVRRSRQLRQCCLVERYRAVCMGCRPGPGDLSPKAKGKASLLDLLSERACLFDIVIKSSCERSVFIGEAEP